MDIQNRYMDRLMMDGWINRYMDVRINIQIVKTFSKQIDNGFMDGWIDEQINGLIDEYMDGILIDS